MGSTARKQCSSAIIMFVIVTVWTSQVTPRRLKEKEASLSERHEQWMAKYGKTYKDFAEKERRLQIFKNNVEFIESFNAKGNKSYKVSINEFADQTSKEFMASSRRIDGLMRLTTDTASFRYGGLTAVPDAVDWRSRGAVTPINAGGQGACGNSWAFATVAATEGIYEITTGKLVRLSQQELVDCWGSLSTEDGYYEFIVKHGITSESNYPPSTSCNDTCNTHMENSPVAHIKGYEKVPSNSEDSLLKAVANQPVSAGVDGASQAFQFYSSGVFEGDCGTDLNLGVAVVGYGGDGTKYWIVKNSWGASWGEGGYIRIKRGIKEKQGLCGIAMDASYPVA